MKAKDRGEGGGGVRSTGLGSFSFRIGFALVVIHGNQLPSQPVWCSVAFSAIWRF